jgi:hypothetical protein
MDNDDEMQRPAADDAHRSGERMDVDAAAAVSSSASRGMKRARAEQPLAADSTSSSSLDEEEEGKHDIVAASEEQAAKLQRVDAEFELTTTAAAASSSSSSASVAAPQLPIAATSIPPAASAFAGWPPRWSKLGSDIIKSISTFLRSREYARFASVSRSSRALALNPKGVPNFSLTVREDAHSAAVLASPIIRPAISHAHVEGAASLAFVSGLMSDLPRLQILEATIAEDAERKWTPEVETRVISPSLTSLDLRVRLTDATFREFPLQWRRVQSLLERIARTSKVKVLQLWLEKVERDFYHQPSELATESQQVELLEPLQHLTSLTDLNVDLPFSDTSWDPASRVRFAQILAAIPCLTALQMNFGNRSSDTSTLSALADTTLGQRLVRLHTENASGGFRQRETVALLKTVRRFTGLRSWFAPGDAEYKSTLASDALSELVQLEEFCIRMHVRTPGIVDELMAIGRLTHLTSLEFDYHVMTSAHMVVLLRNLVHLTELRLPKAGSSFESLRFLKHCPKLQVLEIGLESDYHAPRVPKEDLVTYLLLCPRLVRVKLRDMIADLDAATRDRWTVGSDTFDRAAFPQMKTCEVGWTMSH